MPLGGVALILLYFRPAWLFESGFQLSFAAALLIVGVAVPILERTTEPYRRALWRLDDVLLDDYFSPRIAQTRLDLRALVYALRRRVGFFDRFPALSRNIVVAPVKLLVWVANILTFSAVLQLGLLLPMVETFHRVTFAGVGLNALAIPVMTLLLALALPTNLLSVASPAVAAWPAKVLSLVMALLFEMTHLPGLAAWLSYRMPTPPLWVACGFCGAFVLAGLALRYARRAVGAALAACAVFVVLVAVHPFAPRLPRGVLQLTALDCGRGEAVFLVLPDWGHNVGECRRQPHAGSAGGWLPGPALGFGRGYCFTLPVVARHQEDRCGGAHSRVPGPRSAGSTPSWRISAWASSGTPPNRRLPSTRNFWRRWRSAGFPLERLGRAMRFHWAMRQFGRCGRKLSPATQPWPLAPQMPA